MAVVTISGCQGCGACLLTCPEHAIVPVPAGLRVRADRCTGCLECLEICPVDAISPARAVSLVAVSLVDPGKGP
jgi:Pyruvate/2-oxoacid:ferredoxin oxidoreductase delta subunit